MADYLPAFQTELYAKIAATWTDIVVPDGLGTVRPTLFTTEQALKLSIIEFMKDGLEGGQGRPAPPYAFVDIGNSAPAEWTINQDVQVTPMIIYYVDCDHDSHVATQQYVSAKLWAMKRAIDDSSFTTFEPVEYGAVDVSPSNPITNALEAVSKVRLIGGMVYWRPGWLVNFG